MGLCLTRRVQAASIRATVSTHEPTSSDADQRSLAPALFASSWTKLLPGAVALAFVLGKLPTLFDPHTWDALSCYLPQARFLLEHGTDWDAYRSLPYLRPPVLTGSVAALLGLGASYAAVRVYLWLWALAGLFGTHRLARALGGDARVSILAMALCAATPLYFAQAGLLQLDLAAAVLCIWALVALIEGKALAFVLCLSAAVLTKESSYYLCLPAAVLLAQRAAGSLRPRDFFRLRVVAKALPAAVPCLVLVGWLFVHRLLVGRLMGADHQEALFSPDRIGSALLHNFIEGGRLPLWLLAGLALRAAWRMRQVPVLIVGLAAGLLPLCFAGHPPRYMILSLPPLCVLAARGLTELPVRRQTASTILLFAWLGLGLRGGHWHSDSGDHLEANLAYRELIALHRDAARVLAAAQARAVLSDFPMEDVLRAPPAVGYLPAQVPVSWANPRLDYPALCRHDFLIEADGGSVDAAKRLLAPRGALSLYKELRPTPPHGILPALPWGRINQRIAIYRIRCPESAGPSSSPSPR